MKYRFIFIIFIFIFLLYGCSFLFNEIIMPNRCKHCEVINTMTNEVLWSDEGCGGDMAGMEDRAKIEAYDLSRTSFSLCNLEVVCNTWKEEKDDQ